jgi:hypothetical protein
MRHKCLIILGLTLAVLGCSSSDSGGVAGNKDASAEGQSDGQPQADSCSAENVCGDTCCGSGYTCTFPSADPSKKTCSQLCSCDSDCSKATGCCTQISAPDAGVPVKICVTGGHMTSGGPVCSPGC